MVGIIIGLEGEGADFLWCGVSLPGCLGGQFPSESFNAIIGF